MAIEAVCFEQRSHIAVQIEVRERSQRFFVDDDWLDLRNRRFRLLLFLEVTVVAAFHEGFGITSQFVELRFQFLDCFFVFLFFRFV